MNGSKNRSSIHAAAFLFLFSLGINSCERESHPLARQIARGRFAVPPKGTVAYLQQMTATTRFAGKLVVNRVPSGSDELGVVFLAPETDWEELEKIDRRFGSLRNNCSALPGENSIICDLEFLQVFLEKSSASSAERASRQTAFVRWVLGHELGHVALRQTGGHFNSPGTRRASARNLEVQRDEYAADCWMIRHILARREPQDVFELEGLAIDLINTRLLETQGTPPYGVGILYDYSRLDPYDFLVDDSHPDLLLRSVRILHLSTFVRRDQAADIMVSRLIQKLVPDPLWKEEGPCKSLFP